MQYRKNRKSGDNISVLGYGCMRLPEKNGRIDGKRAETQIFSAIDRGVNYIDTAFPYHRGASEPFLGSILNGRRKDIYLATKLPPAAIHKKEDMESVIGRQLEKLKTDYIDYYMLHGINGIYWNKFRELDVLAFLEKKKDTGVIRQAGFSFHGDLPDFKQIADAYDWDFCQIQYNYLDEKNQAGTEGLEYAAAKGIPVFIMEPLRGGMLGGRMPKQILDMFSDFHIKRNPAEWAMRWILNRPEVNLVLSGMNIEEHIDENIKVSSESTAGCMSMEELDFISRVRDSFFEGLEIGCTGCRYCVPCPQKVDIPFCFEIYNRVKFFGEKKMFDNYFRYHHHLNFGNKGGNQFYASKCTQCGKCIPKCPQGIDIPAKLQKVAKEMETVMFKRVLVPFFRLFMGRAKK
ncbi:MAG: aldo/keto reductase [Spirochaetales bacterium]|nr:aldo/keto reductase [Spirochaetales bacterium]